MRNFVLSTLKSTQFSKCIERLPATLLIFCARISQAFHCIIKKILIHPLGCANNDDDDDDDHGDLLERKDDHHRLVCGTSFMGIADFVSFSSLSNVLLLAGVVVLVDTFR